MLQSELDGKRVVVALGGNALGDAPGEQLKLLEGASKNLARMVNCLLYTSPSPRDRG